MDSRAASSFRSVVLSIELDLVLHLDKGYVTHGSDRAIWALRTPALEGDQIEVAKQWLDRISEEVRKMNAGESCLNSRHMLTLKEDKTIDWTTDEKWKDILKLEGLLESRRNKIGVARPT